MKAFVQQINKGLVNNGSAFSAGEGLTPLRYAKLLSARWAQMTGTTDPCNF